MSSRFDTIFEAIVGPAGFSIGPVYHGGDPGSTIESFDPARSASGVIWFTESLEYAEFTSFDKFEAGASRVYVAYLRLRNPLDLRGSDTEEWHWVRTDAERVSRVKAAGHDGIILDDTNAGISSVSYAVFDPSQVRIVEVIG